jgi:NADPH2:quinone reductase
VKALMAERPGGIEVLAFHDLPMPRPQAGEVLVQVRLAGLNFADIQRRRDAHVPGGMTTYPHPLGREALGTIAQIGAGVEGFAVGQRVAVLVPAGGTHAEFVVAPASATYAIPDSISDEQAAAFPVVGSTAYHVLVHAARAQPGESILVTAAAGGVGTTLIQMARILGLGPVFAAAGSTERVRYACSFGAEAGIDYGSKPLKDSVALLTDDRGVDVALDSVGGALREEALDVLAPFGRLVQFGNATGPSEINYTADGLRGRSVGVFGFSIGVILNRRPDLVRDGVHAILRWIEQGSLRIQVEDIVSIKSAVEANPRLEAREVKGKLLIRMDW